MEEANERIRDAIVNVQRHGGSESNTQVVLNVMRCVAAQINGAGNISVAAEAPTTATQTNRIEDENDVGQHLVSSATVNNVSGSSFYQAVHLGPRELQSLSENVNVLDIDHRWRGEMLQLWRINVNVEYRTTLIVAEDIIVIRYILDFRQPNNGVQYATQIIWNSRLSWRQIMEYLEDHTYNFRFQREIVVISSSPAEVVSSSPAEVVDGLPDVIIRLEDNANGGEVMCTICHEMFRDGESAKQCVRCNHVHHSHCILLWFRQKISFPLCRFEPTASQR